MLESSPANGMMLTRTTAFWAACRRAIERVTDLHAGGAAPVTL